MKDQKTFTRKFAAFIEKYRWAVLLATILLGMGIGGGGSKLKFDGDYHTYFSESNPQLEAFDNLQEKYTKDESVIISLSPKDKNIFIKKNLMDIEEMTNDAWNIPYNSRVDAITNFQHTKAVDDDLYVADLASDVSEMTPADIGGILMERVGHTGMSENFIINTIREIQNLISGSRKYSGVRLREYIWLMLLIK